MVQYIAGRQFRPAALSLTIAALVMGITWAVGDRFDGHWDVALGMFGTSVAVVLIVAWFVDSYPTARAGLLLSVGLWLFTAITAWTALHAPTTAGIAVALAVLAGGSYWADARDPETP